MRKLLVLSALLVSSIGAIYFSSCNNNKTEPEPTSNKDSIDNAIKKGEYLARHVAGCVDCHSQRDLTKYGGPVVPGTEGGGGFAFIPGFGLPGTLYGKNITPDTETGIGSWSDDEVLRAVTQGISKNGDTLFPLMPYPTFNRMPKEDLLNIIAYIRTLKPIKNQVQPRQLMIPIGMAYPGQYLQPSVDGNIRPPESDRIKYGEYLVTFASCTDCHAPLTPQGPDRSRPFAGGHVFDVGHYKVVSANISPDSATGIGTWTEERFLNKFKPYREEKNWNFTPGKENTIMPVAEIAGMKDEDLKAIFAYLMSTPPISNKVEKYPK